MRVRPSLLHAAFACALGLAALPGTAAEEPAPAPAPAPTAEGFASGLAKVRDLVSDAKATAAQTALTKLLSEHAGASHARAKRVELEDLAGRIAFAQACPAPKPQDVVRGKLMTYGVGFNSAAPRLKVAYTRNAPHDFDLQEGLLLHPAIFRGGFSVLVTGPSYPKLVEDSGMVIFGLDEHPKSGRLQVYQVACGTPGYRDGDQRIWLPATLARRDGDREEILKTLTTPPFSPLDDFKVLVKVTEESFSYTANATLMGSAPKARGVFGRVALKFVQWDRIELEGPVEPSWIQGKIDALVQEKRKAFFADFEVRKRLPDWIYEGAAPPGTEPAADAPPAEATSLADDLPEKVDARGQLRVVMVLTQLFLGRHEAAAKLLAQAKGLPPSVQAWLSAQLEVERSHLPEALAALDRTVELAPQFVPARVLRGRVLHRLGRAEEAERALRSVAQQHPQDASVVQEIALTLLTADRQDAARSVLEEATARGLRSERLDALTRALVKVQRGPEWRRSFEHESANYRVISDIDQAVCVTAARVLEEALGVYRTHLAALPKSSGRKYPVYLFSGQAGFQAYMAEARLFGSGGHEHLAGVYSPLLKQLLIWNLPEREEMLETVRHEGFHQVLDRVLPDPPVWFNEGLAVYYENLSSKGGAVKHGNLHHDLLDLLRKQGLPPLEQLLDASPRAFYAGGHASYAHAWLLVHMLRHGSPEHRARFQDLLTRLATTSAHDAVNAAIPPDARPGLHSDLAAYLKGLLDGR